MTIFAGDYASKCRQGLWLQEGIVPRDRQNTNSTNTVAASKRYKQPACAGRLHLDCNTFEDVLFYVNHDNHCTRLRVASPAPHQLLLLLPTGEQRHPRNATHRHASAAANPDWCVNRSNTKRLSASRLAGICHAHASAGTARHAERQSTVHHTCPYGIG